MQDKFSCLSSDGGVGESGRPGTTTHPGLPASQIGRGCCSVWRRVCQSRRRKGGASTRCCTRGCPSRAHEDRALDVPAGRYDVTGCGQPSRRRTV